MATANDIINDALQAAGVIGVGQIPLAENSQLALRQLNRMVGQWNRKRWLVYQLVDTAFTGTGAVSYTVGTAGNFAIARPDRIEAAYVRQVNISAPNQVDYPMQILESREDYSRIALKQLSGGPSYYVFYDPAYPTGALYPWPLVSSSYEIHILTKAVLSTLAALATTVSLPPEYEEALQWNLALRLRPLFQLPPDETVTAMAAASLATIRGANAQIARLTMPSSLRSGAYNIYSDTQGAVN